MATFLSNRDGGKTNEEGHYRFQIKSFTGNVNNGLLVKQNNPLSMSVLVEAGDARIPYQEYGYTWWNDGELSVSLNTADPSNPRDDVIVAYVDRGKTANSNVTNNPDIVKIKAVAGSPSASPTPPNNTAIQTSVGAGNPFMILAQVRVGAGVSTISNGNITDKRVFASPVIADGGITTNKIAEKAVTLPKINGGTTAGVVRSDSAGNITVDKVKQPDIDFSTIVSQTYNGVKSNPSQLRIEMGTVSVPTAATNNVNSSITFNTPFTTTPIILASSAGATTAGGKAYPATSAGAYADSISVSTTNQSVNGFRVDIGRSSNFTSGHTLFVTWIALGI